MSHTVERCGGLQSGCRWPTTVSSFLLPQLGWRCRCSSSACTIASAVAFGLLAGRRHRSARPTGPRCS